MSPRQRSTTGRQTRWGTSSLSVVCQNASFVTVLAGTIALLGAFGEFRLWWEGLAFGLIIVATGFWLTRLLLLRQAPLVFSTLGAPILIVSTYVVMRHGLSEVESVARPHALNWLGAALAFFVMLNNVRHRWQINVLVWVMAGAGAFLAVIAWTPSDLTATARVGGDPTTSLQLIFPLVAATVLFSRRTYRVRLVFLILSLALGATLLMIATPTAWIGGLATVLVLVLYLIRSRSEKRRWLLIGGVMLTGMIAAALIGLRAVQSPMLPAQPTTAVSRLPLWQSAVAIGKSHLILGGGPGMFPWLYRDHRTLQGQPVSVGNEYLQSFAEYGLVGCALLLWVVIAFVVEVAHILAVRAKRYSAHTPSNRYAVAVGGLAAIFGLLAAAVFDSVLQVPGNLVLLVVLMAATLTTGIKHRSEDFDDVAPLGTYNALSLKGISKFVVIGAALVAIALLGTLLRKTYPAAILAHQAARARHNLRWQEADRLYKLARRLDTRNFEFPLALGHLHAARATWLASQREAAAAAAREGYDRALTCNPYATDALVFMGRMFDLLDQPAEALERYQRALRLDPRNASYHTQLGLHYLRHNQTAEALEQFRLAYEYDGLDPLPELQLTRFSQLDPLAP